MIDTIKSFFSKWSFDIRADRIGPDCPFTHWYLHFKPRMKKLCKKKFKYFADSAEFRAGAYAITCSKISIGENVVIRPQTMLFADPRSDQEGYIIIEKDVLIGSGVHIYVANHKFGEQKNIIEQGHQRAKNVILKEGSWIGANAIILPGVTIGKNAVIGAGSIVTKSIPDGEVWAGNPARMIKNKS
ncbi:acyltransferase [Hydrogenimonas sp. SS33]|uniref:acyltransferase n=1 Tax=Hydrogenimonas leucolamina TaxID=2954236 RepID=UPI00336BFE7E